MKFSVGFRLYDEEGEKFSRVVETYREHISEVFFAWQDIPSGRGNIATRRGYTDWSAQKRTEEELRAIHKMGIKLDLLFNGNCYGEYAVSEKLASTVISVLEYLQDTVGGVEIVTTENAFSRGRGPRFREYAYRHSQGNGVYGGSV